MKALNSFLSALLDEDHITDVLVADKILFIQSESRPTKQQRVELEYFFNACLTVHFYWNTLLWDTYLEHFFKILIERLCHWSFILTNTCAKISLVGVRVNKIFPQSN